MRSLILIYLASCAEPRTTPPRPPPPPATVAGCGSSKFLAPPELAAAGPWHVGVRSVHLPETTLEVWYPTTSAGAPTRYDVRTWMPAVEAAKIPDADNAWLPCDCTRDTPVDTSYGPYPVVVFFHGAASFRTQSVSLATHWASRGFIVVAPDLPGVGLDTTLGGEGGSPFGAVQATMELVEHAPASDPLGFIRPQLDPHVALIGHSLGAVLAVSVTDRDDVRVRIALAGLLPPDSTAAMLGVYGEHDQIAPPPSTPSTPQRRIAVIPGAGHLAFTDLCNLGGDRGGPLAIAKAHGVEVPPILETLAMDGCRPTDAPAATTGPQIRAITSGVLEQVLHCDAAATRELERLHR